MAILHVFLLLEFILADQLEDIYFILGLQVTLVIMMQLGSIFQIPLCIISVCDCNGSTRLCCICFIRCYRYIYGNINSTTFFSPAIESKISAVSYDNPAWHTDFCKEDASATSCKIFQTLYLCLTAQFSHTNIYGYI